MSGATQVLKTSLLDQELLIYRLEAREPTQHAIEWLCQIQYVPESAGPEDPAWERVRVLSVLVVDRTPGVTVELHDGQIIPFLPLSYCRTLFRRIVEPRPT